MTTTTRAGGRALAMYRLTRRRRRRRIIWALALLAAAAGVASGLWRLPTVVAVALAAGGAACGISASIGGVRDPERWRRGAEGEQETADLLDALTSRRWAVWHDLRVPGSRANIDHLVLGRTGVWVVDTKTTRGDVRSRWRSVRLGERRLDTSPVRWEADVVAERLEAAVGGRLRRPLTVRPIVAVHSSGIDRRRVGWRVAGGCGLPPRGVRGLPPRGVRGLPPRGVRVGGVPVVQSDRLVPRIRRGRRRIGRSDRALIRCAVEETLV